MIATKTTMVICHGPPPIWVMTRSPIAMPIAAPMTISIPRRMCFPLLMPILITPAIGAKNACS